MRILRKGALRAPFLCYDFAMDAVIFDFDGTLLQSEQEWDTYLWPLVESTFPEATKKDFDHLLGMTTKQGYSFFAKRYQPVMDWTTYQSEIIRFIPKLYATAPMSDGVLELLMLLKKEGVPMGIATSSERNWVLPSLESHKILPYFDTIVTVDDVGNPKPAPDPYLLAANKLGVDPIRCIGIEDSSHGMKSVKSAGMKCVVYAEKPIGHEDMHITHFREIDPQKLRSLFE